MSNEIRFRKGQDKVMEYDGGYMAVPSVPGAGKTFVLTQLAAKLIEEGRHRPGKILIVTYMNSAVANFKDRIHTLLEERGINPREGYEVMTLHTLAMKIIKEKPDKLLLDDDFTILDKTREAELFKDIFSSWYVRNRTSFQSLIDRKRYSHQRLASMEEKWIKDFYHSAIKSFGYFKVQGYDAKSLIELVEDREDMIPLRWLAQLYIEYESALRARGFIDFNDILVGAVELLKRDRELLERYQNRYTFIFEDEAQDSNPIQQELLTMLSEDTGNLLRVGDSNQAIMSTFTISDPKLFRDFCENPFTKVQSINVASRSCRDVIDIANFFVRWTRQCHPCKESRESLAPQYIEEVDSLDPFPNPVVDGKCVHVEVSRRQKDEFRYIVDRCVGHVRNRPDKTIAVLVPANWMVERLADELEKRQVPYRELTSYPRERAYAAKVIGVVLDFIIAPYKNTYFVDVVKHILEDEDPKDLEKLSKFLMTVYVEEILYPLYGKIDREEVPTELIDSGIWDRFEAIIPILKEFLEISSEMPEYLVLHIAERLNFDFERMAIAQKIAGDIRYLVSLDPNWSLLHLAQELKSVHNPYNYFANIVYDMQGFEPNPGEVTISTLHKSKGLEWDTVILASLTSKDFPAKLNDWFRGDCYYLKEKYQNPDALAKAQFNQLIGRKDSSHDYIEQSKIDTINERIRLLYVGITRAKEYLVMSSYEEHSLYSKVFCQYLQKRKQDGGEG